MTIDLQQLSDDDFKALAPAVARGAQVVTYGDEAVAWSRGNDTATHLDQVESMVVLFLDASTDFGTIAEDVQAAIGVPATVALRRLRVIAQRLVDGGMLESPNLPNLAQRAPSPFFLTPPNP